MLGTRLCLSAMFRLGAWYYNPKVKGSTLNQRLSFSLLQKAGYSYSNRGWYQRGVTRQLAFRILTVKDFQDVAQVISDDFCKSVCRPKCKFWNTPLSRKIFEAGDFDVFLWSRSAGVPTGLFFGMGHRGVA